MTSKWWVGTFRKGTQTKEESFPVGGGKKDHHAQIRKLENEGWTVERAFVGTKSGKSIVSKRVINPDEKRARATMKEKYIADPFKSKPEKVNLIPRIDPQSGKLVYIQASEGVAKKWRELVRNDADMSFEDAFNKAMAGQKYPTPKGKVPSRETFVPKETHRMKTQTELDIEYAMKKSVRAWARGEWKKMTPTEKQIFLKTMALSPEGFDYLFKYGEEGKVKRFIRGEDREEDDNLLLQRIIRMGDQKEAEKDYKDTLRHAFKESIYNPISQLMLVYATETMSASRVVSSTVSIDLSKIDEHPSFLMGVTKGTAKTKIERGILGTIEAETEFAVTTNTMKRELGWGMKRFDTTVMMGMETKIPRLFTEEPKIIHSLGRGFEMSVGKNVDEFYRVMGTGVREIGEVGKKKVRSIDWFANKEIAKISQGVDDFSKYPSSIFESEVLAISDKGLTVSKGKSRAFKLPRETEDVFDLIKSEGALKQTKDVSELVTADLEKVLEKEIERTVLDSTKIKLPPSLGFSVPAELKVRDAELDIQTSKMSQEMSRMTDQMNDQINSLSLKANFGSASMQRYLQRHLNLQIPDFESILGRATINLMDTTSDLDSLQIPRLGVTSDLDIVPDIPTPSIPTINIPPPIIPLLWESEPFVFDLPEFKTRLKTPSIDKFYVPSYYAIEFNIEKEMKDLDKILSTGLKIRPIPI